MIPVTSFDLADWASLVRTARRAAELEEAPTAVAFLDELGDRLRDALEVGLRAAQAAESTWDADYCAAHDPEAVEARIASLRANADDSGPIQRAGSAWDPQ